jgi:hypothetical protein
MLAVASLSSKQLLLLSGCPESLWRVFPFYVHSVYAGGSLKIRIESRLSRTETSLNYISEAVGTSPLLVGNSAAGNFLQGLKPGEVARLAPGPSRIRVK